MVTSKRIWRWSETNLPAQTSYSTKSNSNQAKTWHLMPIIRDKALKQTPNSTTDLQFTCHDRVRNLDPKTNAHGSVRDPAPRASERRAMPQTMRSPTSNIKQGRAANDISRGNDQEQITGAESEERDRYSPIRTRSRSPAAETLTLGERERERRPGARRRRGLEGGRERGGGNKAGNASGVRDGEAKKNNTALFSRPRPPLPCFAFILGSLLRLDGSALGIYKAVRERRRPCACDRWDPPPDPARTPLETSRVGSHRWHRVQF
jgi:hypothetical protein